MNRNKSHNIHYISSTKLSNNFAGSVNSSKNMFHKRIKESFLGEMPYHKNNKIKESSKKSCLNINKRVSKPITQKDSPKTSRKKHTYHIIFYSNKNINSIAKISSSVDKIKSNKRNGNYIRNGTAPKKHMTTNVKIQLNERTQSLIHQRCMTTRDIKENRVNSYIKNTNEKSILIINNKKLHNIYKIKNLNLQSKMPIKKLNFEEKRQPEEEKNKNKLEKIKKVAKKIKYDLHSINGIESRQERIKNILYGISYMTEKKKCELCHKIVDRHTYQFHYFSHPSPILNWMFLGTFINANNNEEIKALGIKYILNCAKEMKPRNLPNYIKYCHLNLTDSPSSDITKYFEQAFAFIELARIKKQKILIHCKLGISRSPAILVGYFIKYMGYSTKSSLEFIKSKRSQIHPNSGFISQLCSYERTIRKNQRENFAPNITSSTADFSISK